MYKTCETSLELSLAAEALFAEAPSTGTLVVPYQNAFWRQYHGTTDWGLVQQKLNTKITAWGMARNNCEVDYRFSIVWGTNGAMDKCEVLVTTGPIKVSSNIEWRRNLKAMMGGAPGVRSLLTIGGGAMADRAARLSGTVAKYLQATAVLYEAQARLPGFKCYNKVEFSCAGDVLIIKTSRKRLALQHTLMIEEELIQAHATILKHECTIAELRSKRIKTEPQC